MPSPIDSTCHIEPSAFETLVSLAERLHTKSVKHAYGPIVLAVVGAGASKSADLPLGAELKASLREAFVGGAARDAPIRRLLELEIRESTVAQVPGRAPRTYDELTLFEFAAVLSGSAFGREVLSREIGRALRLKTRMPLAYELIAHLIKHHYVDHCLVLNYDTLLDEAVVSELPERAHIIATMHDLPTSEDVGSRNGPSIELRPAYIVRPFGTAGTGSYSISDDEVARFGPDGVRRFLYDDLLRGPVENPVEPIIMLLVGYAAAEPAFASFVAAVAKCPRTGRRRDVRVVVVDPDPEYASRPAIVDLVRLLRDGLDPSSKEDVFRHVCLTSDDAMEVLVEILRCLWKGSASGNRPVWIPAARHKIVANCCTWVEVSDPKRRFALELLLQGIKSRGFVHLEAFGQVPRLRRWGGPHARRVIDGLLAREVLRADTFLGDVGVQPPRFVEYVPNYMLPKKSAVIDEILSRRTGGVIPEWTVQRAFDGSRLEARRVEVPVRIYLERRLAEIEEAPEIEVSSDATPEAGWILGEAAPVDSIRELTDKTAQMLRDALSAFDSGHKVEIRGIWATGEWLFSEAGWAWNEFGRALLERADQSPEPRCTIEMIITRPGGVRGRRSEQRERVLGNVLNRRVKVRLRNWWEMNRVVTIVSISGSQGGKRAIYMRRRLSRPIVQPYAIETHRGILYLEEIWERYWIHAEDIPSPPAASTTEGRLA